MQIKPAATVNSFISSRHRQRLAASADEMGRASGIPFGLPLGIPKVVVTVFYGVVFIPARCFPSTITVDS